jgi:hypothetical protein
VKFLLIIGSLLLVSSVFAIEPPRLPLLAQIQPVVPLDIQNAKPRVMSMYEQGWNDGDPVGNDHAGKLGWFFAGFGNVPFLWLPWVVEPRRPAKPPIEAALEYNSGYKNGYRAGWKNAHKTYYIAGAIVESVAAGAVIIANAK